jgi:hypothetical protein
MKKLSDGLHYESAPQWLIKAVELDITTSPFDVERARQGLQMIGAGGDLSQSFFYVSWSHPKYIFECALDPDYHWNPNYDNYYRFDVDLPSEEIDDFQWSVAEGGFLCVNDDWNEFVPISTALRTMYSNEEVDAFVAAVQLRRSR